MRVKAVAHALRACREGTPIRTVGPTSPPTVEYRLTQIGESLRKPMSSLVAWANQHYDEVVDFRERYDVRAGTLPEEARPQPFGRHEWACFASGAVFALAGILGSLRSSASRAA
jgi:hypothetical protein